MSADDATAFRAWSHASPPFPSTLSLLPQHPPKPADLKPHEIMVEVVTAALNPVDVQVANLSIFRLPALSYPKGMGNDFAGRILGKGKDVKDFPVGSEVMGVSMNPLAGPNGGTLSEIAIIDLSRSAVVLKPPHLTWAQAAALPLVFLTAKTLLSRPYLVLPKSANPDPTSPDAHAVQPTMVVLGGSSSVGQYVVQLLRKKLHARVIATCSSKNTDFVKDLGADVVVEYDKEDVQKQLTELRPKEGYVEIIDCVGGTDLLPLLPKLLSPRSREYPAGGNYATIVGDKHNRASLGGSASYLFNPQMVIRMLKGWLLGAYRYNCIILATRADWLGEVAHLASDEGLQVPIDSEYDFEAVEQAYERLNTGRARGKIVIKVKKHAP
ncbi:hypothetical protein JCM10207_003943 [Rhodosporidiobolus poonsookiae]